jgi:hypothetical protein
VDIDTRRKKQQELMRRMVERKVRSRAQQLYESRGQTEGRELEDWFKAESEVLDAPGLARLYRRLRAESTERSQERPQNQESSRESV